MSCAFTLASVHRDEGDAPLHFAGKQWREAALLFDKCRVARISFNPEADRVAVLLDTGQIQLASQQALISSDLVRLAELALQAEATGIDFQAALKALKSRQPESLDIFRLEATLAANQGDTATAIGLL
jgi:hypothetical protein